MVKLLEFELQDIDKDEDNNIQKIIKINKYFDNGMFIVLAILGWIIIPSTFPKNSQNSTVSFLQYSLFGVHMVCFLFYFVYTYITQVSLIKKYHKKKFFTLMKLYYAWYQGPWYSLTFFILGVGILMIEGFLLLFIDNGWLALSISVIFWTIIVILGEVIESNSRKKKKKKKEAFDKEV